MTRLIAWLWARAPAARLGSPGGLSGAWGESPRGNREKRFGDGIGDGIGDGTRPDRSAIVVSDWGHSGLSGDPRWQG